MRQRMLHPEYWGDSGLVKAFPYKDDYPGRCLYQFLWNYAEDSGVFIPDMGDIKMKFAAGDPFDEARIQAWYLTLVQIRKVIPFQATDGCNYGWLKRFRRWQRLDNPTPSRLPLPPWVKWVEARKPDPKPWDPDNTKAIRSQCHYEIADWDFDVEPPRPRQAPVSQPIRQQSLQPPSSPALIPKRQHIEDARAALGASRGGERR